MEEIRIYNVNHKNTLLYNNIPRLFYLSLSLLFKKLNVLVYKFF